MLVTIQEGLGPANDYGENELTLASVVKEDLACLGSSSLKKKIQPVVEKKIQLEVEATSAKPQAASFKLDSWYRML